MNRIRLYLTIIIICLTLGSCKKDFEKYNTNHNEPEYGDITPINMLQALLLGTSDCFTYRTWHLNGELIQYTVSGVSTNSYHRFVIPNTVTAGTWNSFAQYAANADEMERLAAASEDRNCQAIAKTIKNLFLSNLADCFGDIPYDEAFGNINGKHIKQPKFDTQRHVYEGILADLEVANTLYDLSEPLDSTKDLLYRGDVRKWQKFTNSLYLRLCMRLSNRNDVFDVAGRIRKVVINPTVYPIFESNADNATYWFDEVEPFVNYFGSSTATSFTSSRRVCSTICDMMSIPGDPRISVYFKQGGERWQGRQSGMPVDETDLSGNASLNRDNLGQYSSPYSLMKYDELLFILSEATKYGWLDGGDTMAAEYYRQAITASIRYWESIDTYKIVITDRTIENFLAKVPYDGSLQQILDQKYVALFWVGYEAWHEYRRTGFPKLVIGTATANDHILPTRFQYPDNTANVNIYNYQQVLERLRTAFYGDDDMKTPVWWSKRAIELGIE